MPPCSIRRCNAAIRSARVRRLFTVAEPLNELHRGREVLLLAFALYLMTSWVQLQATQKPLSLHYSFPTDRLRVGLVWYVEQIGASERNESWFAE